MIIKNGLVFCEDNQFHKKNIVIRNNTISSITSDDTISDTEVYDASNKYIIPGLIDIHSHGALSHDCSDGDVEGLLKILEFEKSMGVTSYCPTTMTLSKESIISSLSSIKKAKELSDSRHSNIVGINLEGPFLDPVKKGAHDEQYIVYPDIDLFKEFNNACNNMIKLVTLAPNQKGSVDFISSLNSTVNISLGHSSADYDISKKAFDLGANHVTHLFNAMNPLSHRDPGLIGAAFDSDNVFVELICDGIHINETIIRLAFNMFKERVVLISDSMRATGLSDGRYDLGGQEVFVSGKKATLENGTIAGSVTCLFDCMKKAVTFGLPLETVIPSVTSIPAKSIGLTNVGTIKEGNVADLLVLNKDLELEKII